LQGKSFFHFRLVHGEKAKQKHSEIEKGKFKNTKSLLFTASTAKSLAICRYNVGHHNQFVSDVQVLTSQKTVNSRKYMRKKLNLKI
jgi:hypothetical protein